VVFHRILKGFMIQTGDPTGTGRGGQSAWGGYFEDNIHARSDLYKRGYVRGVLAMANHGPDTNGSQFFIMHQDYDLPPRYVIFGVVTRGLDVVDALANTPTAEGPTGERSKPVVAPVIRRVTILP
jgi:cyclophilin family peptidyl-prolyl cis-trans isomerase